MKTSIIFSHKCGQLGNRLFAFAHLIAIATEKKYNIINLSFDDYAQYFQTTNGDTWCRYPIKKSLLTSNRLRTVLFQWNRVILKLLRMGGLTKSFSHAVVVADLPEYQFDDTRYYPLDSPEFHTLVQTTKWTFLFGRFFRDYTNVVKHQNIIREFFRPTSTIQKNVSEFLEKVRKGNDIVVGVHIRRGDYAQFVGGKYFYSQQDYLKKMLELQSSDHAKKFTFVICSNETIDSNQFKELHCFTGPGHLVEDMYTFAGCDLIMGPPSTYTKWASFYGNVPLFQLQDLKKPVRIQDFVMLPPENLFNF